MPFEDPNTFKPRRMSREYQNQGRSPGLGKSNMVLPTSRSVSDSYTSSLSPSSPIAHTNFYSPRSRSPSPSRLQGPDLSKYSHPHSNSRRRASSSRTAIIRYFKPYLTPRVIGSLVLWMIALWMIHSFFIPLPIPRLTSPSSFKPNAADHHLSNLFPQPPLRAGDDLLDSVDPRWRPFEPLSPPDPPFPRLRPTRFLPSRCLEQWFADGETLCGKGEMGDEETLDATWLWVNGSDHRWQESMIHWRKKEGVYSPEHHFREQNELVHSMRSVLDALPGHLSTFHLILADYPFEVPNDLGLLPESILEDLEQKVASHGDLRHSHRSRQNDIDQSTRNDSARSLMSLSASLSAHLSLTWRVVQTPTWLDFSRRDKTSPSHPFHPFSSNQYRDARNKLIRAEANYPTLRYASHSEIFHLPSMDRDGLTEELGEREWREREWRKKALPSFNSMAIESRADVTLSLNDDFFLLRPHAVSDFHSPLYGSVIRFDHGYYQQVRPMLDKNRFNDAGEVGGLYHANYLLSQRFPRRLRPYFAHVPKVITRGLHHEASLMFKEALAESSQRRFREMMLGEGDIQMQWLLTSLRLIQSASMDGHMPPILKAGTDPSANDKCVLDLDRCFGSFWSREEDVPSADMFKRLTFQYPECGDCLLMALVTASGPLGLSAFFPPKGTTFETAPLSPGQSYPRYLPPPHLPLTPTWHEADFSLEAVMSTTALPGEAVGLREYTMKLLSRYQYLSAKSESHFHMLKSAEHAHRVFKMIQDNPRVSILGLNDDIEQDYAEVKGIMLDWFTLRWPRKAVWERGWDPVKDKLEE
ncbi:3-O-alpha-D-mannopyranosyl-alpha-D-mannopyranose xylosylphosphotransferase [Kwoniella europaea PYCC6329]|uniref:3-O-alpha-D-mannopyranosyl-alpha-D-mannopyranose xylosylphosphotransferase n=1 Tax=Kwoniella europaea PYCC6329 TaxID=1423913 RepID=A0AAX4KN70_9TREE